MNREHFALYGNVRLLRAWCDECGGYAFILSGEFACCGKIHASSPPPKKYKRMSEPVQKRHGISNEDKTKKLKNQDFRCFYCLRLFGDTVWLISGARTLKIHWDHMVPFAYSQNNHEKNFVAACQLCNLWKSSMMFQTVDEARIYLNGIWTDRLQKDEDEDGLSTSELYKLWGRVRPKKGKMATLL